LKFKSVERINERNNRNAGRDKRKDDNAQK
jgi:hypothetical protein